VNYLLDFRASDVGGAVVPGTLVRGAGLGTEADLRAETSVAFLIHGFNVNRAGGVDVLQRLAGLLPAGTGMGYVGVLWPGDHWVRAISYSFEGRDADDSSRELTKYIGIVIPKGTQLSFLSHSLGARVVMETIKKLNRTHYPIRQVSLTAAAIDDFSLARPRDYSIAVAKSDRVAVLASQKDLVLKLAYPAGDALQAFIFFRRDSFGLALGSHGPKPSGNDPVPKQVYHEQIPDSRGADHGHYFPGNPAGQSAQVTANQQSAVAFSAAVLQGGPQPKYV
jgi:alpha/beta hydrolase family protein DUF900